MDQPNEVILEAFDGLTAIKASHGSTKAQRAALHRLGKSNWLIRQIESREQASKLIQSGLQDISLVRFPK